MNTEWKPIGAHWYAVDKHGAATLCTCEEDARETAAESAQMFPNCAPYTAVQLAPVSPPTSHPIPTGATGEDERKPDLCPRCDGSGEVTVLSDNSPDAHDVNMPCDHCQGSGAAVDAAKYLAAALSGEKYRPMQLWAEYRNFHRSLCARFGYGHDPAHFRRDLVSLEEAIAAKVNAPAAGDALDAARYRAIRNPPYSDRYGDLYAMTFQGDGDIPLNGDALDAAADSAIAASQQREG